MKVRRYFAPDMRTALAAARREQGAEVLIIGQRRVDGGLELITADEYDEEMLATYTPSRSASRPALADDTASDAKPAAVPSPRPARAQAAVSAQSRSTAAAVETGVRPHVFPPASAVARAEPQSVVSRKTAAPASARSGAKPGQATAGRTAAKAQKNEARSETLWTREPVFEQMRNELSSLRGLLQQQFATLAWGEMRQRHPLWAYLLRRAVSVGIPPRLARDLVQGVAASFSFDQGWQRFLNLFAQRLRVSSDELLVRGGAAVLVGPTGVGKTTLVCKLAAQFALKHGSRNVALITADSQRIAAHEQLRSFGRLMGIPVRVAAGVEELLPALDAVYDRKLVLVDTAGMSHRDRRLDVTLAALRDLAPLVRTYVVASASTPERDLEATFARYAPASPAAAMLTKLDEVSYLAPALSAAILHQLPLAYVSGGQRIPEDCEAARADQLIARALTAVSADGHVEKGEADLMMEGLFRGGDKAHAHA